ncbi:MAG: PTS sugar transporter subunit IIA [Wenzhouxiangella sp.]
MTGILLVTHDGVAEALCRQVEIILDRLPSLTTVSIAAEADVDAAEQTLREAMAVARDEQGLVILTDLPGATPHNLAARAAAEANDRLVSGLSLPMLLKVISHAEQPPDVLARLASEGGYQGIIQA